MIPLSFGLCMVRGGSGSYQGSPANMLRGQAGQLFSIFFFFLEGLEITLLPCNLYNIIVGTTTKTQTLIH